MTPLDSQGSALKDLGVGDLFRARGGAASGGAGEELGEDLEDEEDQEWKQSDDVDSNRLILSVQQLIDQLQSNDALGIDTKEQDLGEPNQATRAWR